MISSAGGLRTWRRAPYIYFIGKLRYLYIGQTQDVPVVRWGAHMDQSGSFWVNLRRQDEEALLTDSPICFTAYRCEDIAKLLQPVKFQFVTQYVEHMVHVKVICHPLLGTRWTIISDTTRTAVAFCKYRWADDMAEQIVERFAADSVGW